ncbi:hypothetical protein [Brevibacterium otitidis]|uniref:Uncharacterized protein n=1 Tax=Brevibacterium otitidis TaxID=53364 RepID=A0ABV5WZ39_9MICO
MHPLVTLNGASARYIDTEPGCPLAAALAADRQDAAEIGRSTQ